MRRLITPCACLLALITGAWFGQAYALFAPVELVRMEDATNRAAVSTAWRFYDAIDALLRAADDSAILAVIAPDFVDHVDEPGTSSNRDGLVRYLASLRDTQPTLHLAPQDIVAHEDLVVVRLAPIDASGGTILGVPLAGYEPWPRVEMLRVHGGQIVERWGDPAGYAPAIALFSETLAFSHHGDLIPTLQRVTVAPGAIDAVTQRWPAIISIESGELEVTVAKWDASLDASAPASLEPETFTAGDSIPIQDGFAVSVANRAASPAVFLAFALAPPASAVNQAPEVYLPATSQGVTEGISVQDLAGNTTITTNPGRLTVELARVTLAPGGRLAPHPVSGLEIVVVETGAVAATIAGNPVSAWLRDPQGRSVAASGSAQVPAGFSLTVASGGATAYANESTQPATLLLLTMAAD
jgi:predicted ester cyclase